MSGNQAEENVNGVAVTQETEDRLDWQQLPEASSYELWLNTEPKKVVISEESKEEIGVLKSTMSIDYLRVVSQWSHGVSVPLRLIKSGTLSFILQPSNFIIMLLFNMI
jgi:hypothetical protein